jgi:hypothetical protein
MSALEHAIAMTTKAHEDSRAAQGLAAEFNQYLPMT